VAEGAAFLRDAVSELAELQAETADDGAEVAENAEDHSDDAVTEAIDQRDPHCDAAALGAEAGTAVPSAAQAGASAQPAAGLLAAIPTLDAADLAHFRTIAQALSFREQMLMHEVAAQRSAAELRSWVAAMLKLSIPEAVAKVRELVAILDAAPNRITRENAS
jgi:hypothetical protein